MYGIGKGSVLRILEDAGIPLRDQPLTDDQELKAVGLSEYVRTLFSFESIVAKLAAPTARPQTLRL